MYASKPGLTASPTNIGPIVALARAWAFTSWRSRASSSCVLRMSTRRPPTANPATSGKTSTPAITAYGNHALCGDVTDPLDHQASAIARIESQRRTLIGGLPGSIQRVRRRNIRRQRSHRLYR
jgi:hypothetical protein